MHPPPRQFISFDFSRPAHQSWRVQCAISVAALEFYSYLGTIYAASLPRRGGDDCSRSRDDRPELGTLPFWGGDFSQSGHLPCTA